ncbi:hypothetical protein ACHHYP_02578 [Achlya hypogyna]|uniref:Leucine-rich repeat domain-containing protein n=1 Tax=Achlya hypogyna TaxID=1202772 RepID=A0A1V9Z633_ACHHY|nr:hypothetical protein ACHHYP_02578 [Achlya hypogyna]
MSDEDESQLLAAPGDEAPAEKAPEEPVAEDEGPPPIFKLFSEGLSRIDRTADNSGFAFTAVDINDKELASLDQIKDFRHLRYVNVARNKLADATPVSALEYLIHLNLANNLFTTVPKLKNPHLKALDLSKNQLPALGGGDSRSLELLKVNGNQITSLDGLADFPGLKALEISQNAIADMTTSSELPSIESLIIAQSENQLTGLQGLAAFPNLTSFKAELNQIATLADIAPLGGLTKLTEVDLTGNAVTDVEHYRLDVLLLVPALRKLDGLAISDDERVAALQLRRDREAPADEPQP